MKKTFKNLKSNWEAHLKKADAKEDAKERQINHNKAIRMAYKSPLDNQSVKQIKLTLFRSYFYIKQSIKAALLLFIGAVPEDFVMNLARNISANYRSAPQALFISESSMNFWRLVAAGIFLYSIYLVIHKIEWIPCRHLGYLKRAHYLDRKQMLKLRVQSAKQTLDFHSKGNKASNYKQSHIVHSGIGSHAVKGDNK